MADELKITITGKDGVSKVFQAIGKSGTDMEKSLETAVKNVGGDFKRMASEASSASTTVVSANRRTSDSFKTIASSAKQNAAIAGAAFGGLAVVAARSVQDQQVSLIALQRNYGDAAQSFIDFAETIQNTTVFSNDQALAAANVFSTLKTNYGFTEDQIRNLISVSADLASLYNITLTDAAQRVQSALRGEGESAEALGLTMNQAAIDAGNLTLTMSNQEAGQFRYNALLEQTTRSQGAAAEVANTTAGRVRQLGNEFQDATQSAIKFTGPLGEVIAGATSMGSEVGLAVLGLSQMVAVAGKATVAMRGLAAAEATAAGGAGLAGLSSTIGGAAGAAGGGLVAALGGLAGVALLAAPPIIALTASLYLLNKEGDKYFGELDANTAAMNTWLESLGKSADLDNLRLLAEDIRDLGTSITMIDPATMTATVGTLHDTLDELTSLSPESIALLTQNLADLGISIGNLDPNDVDTLTLVGQEILNVYATQEAQLQATAAAQYVLLEANRSSIPVINAAAKGYGTAAAVLDDYAIAAQNAAIAQYNLLEANRSTIPAINANAPTPLPIIFDLANIKWRNQQEVEAAINSAWGVFTTRSTRFGQDIEVVDSALGDMAVGAGKATVEQSKLNEVLAQFHGVGDQAIQTASVFASTIEANDAVLVAAIGRLREYREAGVQALEGLGTDSLADKLDFSGISNPQISLAVDTGNAVSALSDVYGAIVKNTNAIGDQTQGIADWIGEFTISTDEQVSKLDELRANGKISEGTYRAAVTATNRVLRDNALIQEDLARIQAKQAPLIADLTREQAEYIDSLADSDAATQLVALGYMDATASAKAFSAVQLAANAALGGFEGVAEKSIVAAAQADPVLRAMLEDMQLISVGADGTITVNFDNADSLKSAVSDLADVIQDLTIAINGIPSDTNPQIQVWIDGVSGDASGTNDRIQSVVDHLNTLDGSDADPTVTVNDNATDELIRINNLLDWLDTRDVNTTVTTTYRSVGQGFTESRHGGIAGYAHGGMVPASLFEAGPELLRFSNGGQAIGSTPGVYMIEPGTNVLPAPATARVMADAARSRGGGGESHNYYGPVTQTVTLDNSSFARRRQALASSRR